jgi:sigma-B regulation protein RsbU (phosphoserine phosphatase)
MLSSAELSTILSRTPLFAGAPEDVLNAVGNKMQMLRLSEGDTLFNEGELADGLYLVVKGKVAIWSGAVEIQERIEGEYVGELALLDHSPHSATVRAKTDVMLLKLHRGDFHQVLSTSPQVVSGLLRILGQKIKQDTVYRIAAVRQQEQHEYDLKRAHEIQTTMLPTGDFSLEWMHLTGKSQPAAQVGGDYYDYFHLPDGRVSVAIGDVAGHGFYSGLLVALVSSGFDFQMGIDPSPSSVLTALNKIVRNYRHTRMLMTFSYLILNHSDCTLTFANAGHPHPYLYRAKEQRWSVLKTNGSPPLGTRLKFQPEPKQISWQSGDRLFLYSDGLTEARGAGEEGYGTDALERFLNEYALHSPHTMITALDAELTDFCSGNPLQDDFTVVIVQLL